MEIISLPIGPLEANCYLIFEGNDAIIIDPPSAKEEVLAIIKEKNLTVHKILCTHMHFDHISGCKEFKDLLGVEILAGAEDNGLLINFSSGRAMNYGFPKVDIFDYTAFSETNYKFGNIEFAALHCPGHSPGSYCFYFKNAKSVITGDVLFRRSIGRSDLPGGNHEQLINSITTKLFTLPAETVAYPGHGYETNIAYEKSNNPFI